MPAFLVESYAAGGPDDAVARVLSAEGGHVRHVRSTFVPEDEMVLHFLEGPSREAVTEALRRAGVAYDRVVEAREPGGPAARGAEARGG